MSIDLSGGYSQQFPVFNITRRDGAYVTPYSEKLKILTGANFTLDQRDKIYLRDDSAGINFIILFYKEQTADKNELNAVQGLMLSASDVSTSNTEFRICNLNSDSLLLKSFEDIKLSATHPFNWIQSAKNPDIFILIYSSGYPQMFYEGPLTVSSLTEFAGALAKPSVSGILYTKFGTANGFTDVKGTGKTYKEQAWASFDSSKNKPYPNLNPALLSKIDIGEISGLKEKEYPSPSYLKTSENKDVLFKRLLVKVNEIAKSGKANNLPGLVGGENDIFNSNYGNNDKDDKRSLITDALKDSIYKNYYIPYESKKENNAKTIQKIANYLYKITKKLYSYKDIFELKDEQVARLAVNMYGLYLLNQYSATDKVSTETGLVNYYTAQNTVYKNVPNVKPTYVQNIVETVSGEIYGENEATIKKIAKYLNINESDAADLFPVIEFNYNSNENEKERNDPTNWKISQEDIPSDLKKDELLDSENVKYNLKLKDIYDDENSEVVRNLFKIVKDKNFNPPQSGGKTGGGGGGGALGRSGGGNRGGARNLV